MKILICDGASIKSVIKVDEGKLNMLIHRGWVVSTVSTARCQKILMKTSH